MQFSQYALLLTGMLGHLALWVALFNRNHAIGFPRRVVQATEKFHIGVAVGVLVYWWCRVITAGFPENPTSALFSERPVEAVYFFVCCGFMAYVAVIWLYRRLHETPPANLLDAVTVVHDVQSAADQPLASGAVAKALALVPRNEMTKLSVTAKSFALPLLDTRLENLTIAHLSDLHFTGKLTRKYFDFVVDRVNEMQPDLIVVTGDIVDKDECVTWIPETLGRLRARYAKFFILGNHDKRVSDVSSLRRTITDAGFVDLGSRWEYVFIDGCKVLFAGNERPWFGVAPDVPPVARGPDGTPVLRILLSHSPDQLPWARRHNFDLMFAGHTHGGQIRLPLIGPIVAPSHFGVKYASGVFFEFPTLVHVSRGVSGLDPIRINCLPEVTKVTLRAAISDKELRKVRHPDSLLLAEPAC
ncbi:MAG: metallophosphoesterase [Planctomycetaceae bacterium]|nr:metallophosphoesterase [Planctomycetales bacterium]MCB9872758.1 metallophosphoesterase [Planctomycetaceae bacterium]MCB9926244.1 metallophosphoesterase [Planctomycetaceae bacterium]